MFYRVFRSNVCGKVRFFEVHFWRKNGFEVIREVDREGWPVLEAERAL